MKTAGRGRITNCCLIGLPLFLLFFIGAPGAAFSQNLAELENVTLRDDQGQFWVTVWSDAPVADYHLSYACSPYQLLIDLPGKWKKPSRTRYPLKHDTVKSIAVRHFKDRIQVVLYLKTRKNLAPYIDVAPEGLVLKLKKRHLFDLPDGDRSCAVAAKAAGGERKAPDAERQPQKAEADRGTVNGAEADQEKTEGTASDGEAPETRQLEPPSADKGKTRPFRAVTPEQMDEGVKLLIDLDGPVPAPKVFTLMDQKPPKLVLDFPGIWDNPGPTVLEVQNELIQDIRVGVHDAFLRIVVDLGFTTPPVYDIEEAAQGIALILSGPESKQQP